MASPFRRFLEHCEALDDPHPAAVAHLIGQNPAGSIATELPVGTVSFEAVVRELTHTCALTSVPGEALNRPGFPGDLIA
jgi:hypothetical protein